MLCIFGVIFLSRLIMLNLTKTSSLLLVSFWSSLSPQPSVSTPSPFCWCPCNSPLHIRDTEDERWRNQVTPVMSLRGITKGCSCHRLPQLFSGLAVDIVVKCVVKRLSSRWWRRLCRGKGLQAGHNWGWIAAYSQWLKILPIKFQWLDFNVVWAGVFPPSSAELSSGSISARGIQCCISGRISVSSCAHLFCKNRKETRCKILRGFCSKVRFWQGKNDHYF